METDKYIFFCSHKPDKYNTHIFSQWFPVTFNDGKTEYSSAEQYMMAQKALLFGDYSSYNQIMNINEPRAMKEIGRNIKGFNELVWNDKKFGIVVQGNRLKFDQNPDLMKRLILTGDKLIAEAAHYDNVWGIGLNAEDAVKIPEDHWPGENLLGKAIMYIREENVSQK